MAVFAGSTYDVITKFLPDAVDEYFVADSKTVILEHGSKFIDVNFDEAGYVKIADTLLDGLSNYYQTQIENDRYAPNVRPANPADFAAYAGNLGSGQRDGFQIGGADVKWEIFRLQWCRGRQFRIDHIANEETGKVVTGGLIEKFHKEKVIPEVDACRLSVIANAASVTMGNLLTETVGTDITEANILSKFFAARKWLVENEVPLEELVWFLSPDVYEILVNSEKLTKFITQADYKSDSGLTIQIKKFNDVPIIEVPSSRFFTNVLVTNNGFQAQSTSKVINHMMCSKKAVIPIRKIEHSKIYDESMSGLAGFYGTIFNYLLYHGVVIPKNKMIGTYVSVGGANSAATKTGVLLVDLQEGKDSGSTILRAHFTRPSALRGTVVYAPAATGEGVDPNPFTVGGAVTGIDEVGGPVSVNDGDQFTSAETALYFALVDYRGICIARTGAVTLVKKA